MAKFQRVGDVFVREDEIQDPDRQEFAFASGKMMPIPKALSRGHRFVSSLRRNVDRLAAMHGIDQGEATFEIGESEIKITMPYSEAAAKR